MHSFSVRIQLPQAIFMVLDVPKNSIYHLALLVVEYFYDFELCLPHIPR